MMCELASYSHRAKLIAYGIGSESKIEQVLYRGLARACLLMSGKCGFPREARASAAASQPSKKLGDFAHDMLGGL
ncbi:hypothetical protein [Bradyrhizobium sp. JR3.5]